MTSVNNDNDTTSMAQLRKDSNKIGLIFLLSYLVSYSVIRMFYLNIIFFYLCWVILIIAANYRILNCNSVEKKINREKNNFNFYDNILVLGLISILSTLLCTIIISILKPPLLSAQVNNNSEFYEILVGGVMGPIVEEIIFRGILIYLLRSYGEFFSLVCSTVLFTLMHGGGTPLVIIIIGFMCGFLFLETNNILNPIILHILHNLGALVNPDRVYYGDTIYTIKIIIVYSITAIIMFLLCIRNQNIRANFIELKNLLLKSDWALEVKKIKTFFTTNGMLVFIFYFGFQFFLNIIQTILIKLI